MKKTKIFFLLATLILAASSAIANDNSSQNTKIPSLDPVNQEYMNNFCTYHPGSSLCITTPNPPVKTPSAPIPTASNDNNGPVRVPLPASGNCSSPTSPLPKSFAPINECGSTVSVTPATLKSNISNGCKTLVMAPGLYTLNINGHSGGVLTMRCAVKGACEVKTDSYIRESSGIILDGIYMDGHCTKGCRTAPRKFLTLTNTSNIKIQNSRFNNMEGTGVLVDQANENKQFNIQLVGNTLHNDIERSFQISGGGRFSYDMDYGFRIHDANSVYIANNTFTGGFNHAVSLKRKVKYALIENNNFVSCGNACIHAGQQGNTTANPDISSDLIEIRNNRFSIQVRQDRSDGVEVMNVHKAIVTNNSFSGFIGDRALHLFYFSNGYNGLSGYINRGVPADRQLIQSGNGASASKIPPVTGGCSSPTTPPVTSPGSPPPPPTSCQAATAAATVNPSNFASAVARLGGGQTIVLAPGSYPSMHLSGKNYGGAKIQCAQPGKCNFASNSELNRVSGLTIEGIATRGSGRAVTITSSQNVTIRCSTFVEHTDTGVLVMPGQGTNQIAIDNNVFFNQTTGCQHGTGNCSGNLSDGSPVANMDYGVRVHSGQNIYVRGNTFGTLFNHSISLKENVASAFISGNTFNKCGRNCIEPGQQASNVRQGDISCGTVTITGNTFNDVKTPMVLVKNIHRVNYSGNRYNNSPGKRVTIYNFTSDPRGYGLLTNGSIINGVPRDRTVSGNGD